MNFYNFLVDFSLPLNPQVCWLFTLSLLHSLWQGLIIAFVLRLILKQKMRFQRKFRIAFLSLVIIAMLPLANFIWQSSKAIPVPVEIAQNEFQRTGKLKLFPLEVIHSEYEPVLLVGRTSISKQKEDSELLTAPVTSAPTTFKTHWSISVYLIVTSFYLLGVLAMTFRLFWGLRKQGRLSKLSRRFQESLQLPDEVVEIAKRAAKSLGKD